MTLLLSLSLGWGLRQPPTSCSPIDAYDYTVIGSEFCSFLSSVITYRLLNRLEKEELFDILTFKKIMHVLTRAKKVKADTSEWQLFKMNPSQIDILQKLELLE